MLTRYELVVAHASVVLALVQNALLLVDSSLVAELDAPPAAWADVYEVVTLVLATAQVVTCTAAVLVTFGRATFLNLLKRWLELTGLTFAETMHALGRPATHPRTVLEFASFGAYIAATDLTLLVRCGFVGAAVAGLVLEHGSMYFVTHLMQVVLQSKALMDGARPARSRAPP